LFLCFSAMEAHQNRLQQLAENRKWQTEMENKRRQLEDERRALQHLKSKVLRERWLLEGPAGPDQNQDPDQVLSQLEEDEARTRTLEESIRRSDLVSQMMTSHSVSLFVSVLTLVSCCTSFTLLTMCILSDCFLSSTSCPPAMYSVEIKVERDRVTGETRVLSTNTKLPVDLSDQGVKVYEDEQKVVHGVMSSSAMNGDDAHLLSSVEVEELIHKADEASVMSHSSGLPPEPEPGSTWTPSHALAATTEITGLEAVAGGEPEVAEASAENPVTMVFMGYQEVEDEDQTRKVLGLQGTVKAELVLIDDGDGKVDPPASAAPPSAGRAVAGKKKQPCKCCSIM
uniref:Paralemmin-1 n=1 Tax=Poecilia latipinna TaxID=48699 RepID=A0A3B3VG71_9TELE